MTIGNQGLLAAFAITVIASLALYNTQKITPEVLNDI